MKKLLNKLFDHQELTHHEAKDLFRQITDGTASDVQIVAAISAMKMRSVTAKELKGFREAVLEHALPLKLYTNEAIDLCGTGGDGQNTFNISTTAAIVIAGAGYKVIKHGNYGVSSPVGSSTILESLGYHFTIDEESLNEQLQETNMCFLHAPLFHPALKKVADIRKDLGVRTFFNFLGPLVNPAQPKYQLTGVYNLQLMRIYKEILSPEREGFKIVHSLDGYDEVSLTGPFKLMSNHEEFILYPEDLGLNQLKQSDLFAGETIVDSKSIIYSILKNEGTSAQKNVVLANAALGIQCFDRSKSFISAFNEAQTALASGQVLTNFEKAISLSHNFKTNPL